MKLWMTRTYDIWNSSEPTNSEDTDSRPCLATYHNTLFCFYRSSTDELVYMKKPENGNWSSTTTVERLNGNDTELSAATFKGTLYILARAFQNTLGMATYKDDKVTVEDGILVPENFIFQVNLVAYKGKLYFFGARDRTKEVHYSSSEDGRTWSTVIPVNYGGQKITTLVSPQVVTYQGLLYLVYKEGSNGYNWMKYDGAGWSHPVKLTEVNYESSPGLVVHNGLLKAIFSDKPTSDRSEDRKVYQYSFDGNCWSLPMPSTMVGTSRGVGAASFEGKLYTVYLGTG